VKVVRSFLLNRTASWVRPPSFFLLVHCSFFLTEMFWDRGCFRASSIVWRAGISNWKGTHFQCIFRWRRETGFAWANLWAIFLLFRRGMESVPLFFFRILRCSHRSGRVSLAPFFRRTSVSGCTRTAIQAFPLSLEFSLFFSPSSISVYPTLLFPGSSTITCLCVLLFEVPTS